MTNLILIPLPEGATDPFLFMDADRPYISYHLNREWKRLYFDAGDVKYELLGLSSDFLESEELAAQATPPTIAEDNTPMWRDYSVTSRRRYCHGILWNARASFSSYLTAHSITQPVAVLVRKE